MFETVPRGFSWSATRHGMFEECRRAYFFHYYLALGKSANGDPSRSSEARRLRSMTTVPMWVGSRVHDAIEKMLRAARRGEELSADQAVEEMIRGMRRDYADSRDDRARKERNYKARTRFHEHEYGPAPSPEQWKNAVDEAATMVRDFAGLGYLAQVGALPKGDLLALEDLEQWSFEGVPVWVKIDLAFRDGDGQVHILDWKTGRRMSDDNPLQMTGYAAYAHRAWDVAFENLAVREVYLRLEQPEKYCTIDEPTMELARGRIAESIGAMLGLLEDPSEDLGREELFEASPQGWRCRRCNFRKICAEAVIEE